MRTFKTKDGIVLNNIPDDVPDDEIKARIQKIRAERGGNAVDSAPESNIPVFQMARESGFLKGLIDPAAGAAQLVSEIGKTTSLKDQMPDISKQVKQEEEIYKKGRKGEGIDWARMGGNILSPMSLASAGTKLPLTVGKRVLAGGAMGGAYGLAQPATDEDYWKQKKEQMLLGTTIGGATPLVTAGTSGLLKKGKEFIEPLSKTGIRRGAERFVKETAEPQKQQIIAATQQAKPGETSGQTLSRASTQEEIGGPLMKLEQELSGEPESGRALRNIYLKQAAGREKAISKLRGTPEQYSEAITRRREATKPLYDAVKESDAVVDTTPVMAKIDQYISENPKYTSITRPLERIKKDLDVSDARSLYSLHKQIKTMMGKTDPQGQKIYDEGVLQDIRDTLGQQIGEAEPAFQAAQAKYGQLSKPINQMDVGKELQKALISSRETESPTTFLNAVKNAPKTLKRATGFPRYREMSQVMPPQQNQAIKNVADELVNQARINARVSQIKSVAKDVPTDAKISLPRILSRPVVIANHLLSKIGHDKSDEYKKVLIDILSDPNKLREIVEGGGRRSMVAQDILAKLSVYGFGQSGARNVGQP